MRTLLPVMLLLLGCLALLVSCDLVQSARLEKAVLAALAKDQRTAEYKFEVSVEDGGRVLITGDIWSPAAFDAVTEIAKGVPGVTSVINNCKLEEQGSGMIQDEVVPSPFL